VFSVRPWGSFSLAPHFPEKSGLAEPIGEAWMTGNESRFANGPFAGQKLGETWRRMPAEWTGTAVDAKHDFPLLVKFLFTEDKLSVQVHPDDEQAAKYEAEAGGRGKTEMWYALRARPGAEVLVGLDPEVTAEAFRRCIEDGTAEECLMHVPMRAGDAIFVPAGAAHTIGAGLLLCEIQQHSDITYRVYDYNRPDSSGKLRDLHIEKAMQVMRFGSQKGGKIQPVELKRGGITESYLAACRYFVTEKWEFSTTVNKATDAARFDLVIFLEGHGEFRWKGQRAAYRPTEVWLLPAGLGEYRLEPTSQTALLRTYVPQDLQKFAAQLASYGASEPEIARLIHS
jgi:mannose-6-phosphate isomerase